MARTINLAILLLLAFPALAADASFNLGRITDKVECAEDHSQSYVLYLPSRYSHQTTWPVIFAFDPRARGRIPVERYSAAAEKYGYIIAGSNNSQNGSLAGSYAAAKAMISDVGSRFDADPKRVYAAGMSGGARVALGLALGSDIFAGVIASSAGFPDSKPRKTVPFVLFGTAGTEDFNYLEMRRLDRALTSPHRVVIFEGGHTWLSPELATEAVERLETQAMKSGLRSRDQKLIDEIFAKRTATATGYEALASIAADFDRLASISDIEQRIQQLRSDKRVREEQKQERRLEQEEERRIQEILLDEANLTNMDRRPSALLSLRGRWKDLDAAARAPDDTPDRRLARRVMSGLLMGAGDRVHDPEYLAILSAYRRPMK